jgi:hypothetical protein
MFKIGNYVNKDGKNIAWMMPTDKDQNDPKQRHHGISPGMALKILNALPQTPEVLAIKSVAEGCSAALNVNRAAPPPPLPSEIKYYVAYEVNGSLSRHDKELNAADVSLFMAGHQKVILCEVGGKRWHQPHELGIVAVNAPKVHAAESSGPPELPPSLPSTPPPIVGTIVDEPPAIKSGVDLMKRVMEQRKAS